MITPIGDSKPCPDCDGKGCEIPNGAICVYCDGWGVVCSDCGNVFDADGQCIAYENIKEKETTKEND